MAENWDWNAGKALKQGGGMKMVGNGSIVRSASNTTADSEEGMYEPEALGHPWALVYCA
jgi:hypothetical protein